MAAPMISGVVADLLQVDPNWTPNQVKGALMNPLASFSTSFQEPNFNRLSMIATPPVADLGLTPSTLLTDASGNINYTQSSWSQSSWSQASGSLSAGFAQSSWSCSCTTSSGTVGPSQSSWSTSSWSTYFGQ
jgi:hypothetical protein